MSRIVDLLSQKGIPFKDTGGDIIIQCLNPEHTDANPSLRVDPSTGAMHCLSCGFGKGIPSIFHYFNESINEASASLLRVRKLVGELLRGVEYLSIPEDANLFKEDYRGISSRTLERYFPFQHVDWVDRLVFPITDAVGRILFFLGRRQNGTNSVKYMVKPKGVPPPVFPMRHNAPVLVLTEGIFDMLNLEDKGVHAPVCCFGTHQFTASNVLDKLSPFIISGTKTVFILLDNDESGMKASEILFRLIRDKTNLRPIIATDLLPAGKDPGELTQEEVDKLVMYMEILLAEEA
ncbi:putative DNA primase [Pectobacterium phage DU_PP_V]|uniref:Putative DNA primase n=1 Tax=Pectobacterium phage DU_PP_V TaxID=2041492 RepID=A0A2D2W705_9CAUD|nr:DNA primase [Pectobacterium phage DU_PP_V]ATS94079.1 putative DNA primase [Pectobacterium phage DU_PP_V]